MFLGLEHEGISNLCVENNAFFHYICNRLSDAVICWDLQGRVLYLNDFAVRIFLKSEKTVHYYSIDMYFENPAELEGLLNEAKFPVQNILVTDIDNKYGRLDIVAGGLFDNFYVAVLRDNTETKLIEQYMDSYHDNLEKILTELVNRKTKSLEKLTIALVNALENANLLNDTETGLHIKRVSEYSGLLAQEYGCDNEIVKKIRLFASLHDVGKVGLSDFILKSRKRFSPDEFETMKKHVVIGARILDNAEIDNIARNIALYHHEKWDGSGYVNGLSGSGIPLEARIVSIADMYDALRSKRYYKPAYNEKKTLKIILSERGKSLDPSITDVLLENHQEFDEIACGCPL